MKKIIVSCSHASQEEEEGNEERMFLWKMLKWMLLSYEEQLAQIDRYLIYGGKSLFFLVN